jgi:hypothetical protein
MPNDSAELTQKFQEMAAKIVVSRAVFAQLYDPFVIPRIPDAQQFLTLSALRDKRGVPNLKDREKDRADFAEALAQAHRLNFLFDLFAKHAGKLFADPEPQSVVLQSIVNLRQTFPPGLQLTLGRIAALRRTCRVLCETAPGVVEKGSGFLIGPHLVLTNWHVIKSMLDAGKEKEDSRLVMKFEFDALLRADGGVEKTEVFRPTEPWLVIAREAHQNETAGGTQGQNGPWPNNADELADKLDFAVIELDGAPGYDRGWYNLADAPWPVAGTALDLFQYPLGRAMSYLTQDFVAPTVFADNVKPPRILHLVNTEKGSSGGLCLDMASRAVALHQAGYQFQAGVGSDGKPTQVAVSNAAIPLAFIATVAGATVADRIKNAPLFARIGPKGEPILGRKNFQKLINSALRGDIRIVTVQTSFDPTNRQPRSKIGKSFSALIMQALLPASNNVVIPVTSARLTSDAYAAARLIVDAIDPHRAVPSKPAGQTSLDADVLATLVKPVIEAMCAAAGNGVLWLIIDDLDRSPVAHDSTTSTFLSALYGAATAQSKLRIVLIGPTGMLPPPLTGTSTVAELVEEHVTDEEVATWIMGELGARLPIVPQLATLMALIARSVADELAKDPLQGRTGAIAQILQAHWAPKIQAQP